MARTGGRVQVDRPGAGAVEWVTVPEAARAMIAWAAQEQGRGTPAFAAIVMRPVELLAGHGLRPGGQRISGTSCAVRSRTIARSAGRIEAGLWDAFPGGCERRELSSIDGMREMSRGWTGTAEPASLTEDAGSAAEVLSVS